ncbi:hypothetical protein [Campylobacter sp. VTCC 70190]|uniref:hypothetical protein n=1 Tax=Campylobacter sp. VTCC 70190 TaxID=3392118 RepID=UPI00398F5BC5
MGSIKRELLRKRKNKYKKEAQNKWRPIIQKYDLRIENSGDFFTYPAEQYGWAKAEKGFFGFIVNLFFGNPLQTIIGIATGFVGMIGHILVTINNSRSYEKALKAYQLQSGALATANIQKAKEQRGAQSEALSQAIVYSEYEIYANGSIYKNQFAGVNNNFSSQIAPDGAKGIYAEFKESKIDNFTQNRSQVETAGNENFSESVLKPPFALAKANDEEENLKMTKEMFLARNLKAIEGFNLLVKLEYGINTYDSFLQNAFDFIDEKVIKPFRVNLKQLDFLAKNKAYNKGILRDFDVLQESDFKEIKGDKDAIKENTEQEKQALEQWEKDFKNQNVDLSIYNKYQIEEKRKAQEKIAKDYIDMIERLFAVVLNGSFNRVKKELDYTKDFSDKEENTLSVKEYFNDENARLFTIKEDEEVLTEGLVSKKEIAKLFSEARVFFVSFKNYEEYVLSLVYGEFLEEIGQIELKQEQIHSKNDLEFKDKQTSTAKLCIAKDYKHIVEYKSPDLEVLRIYKEKQVPKHTLLKDDYTLLNNFWQGV